MKTVEFRRLGNIDVSVIGLGTASTFDVTDKTDIAVRRQIVDNCLTNEINLIDTAPLYGRAEEVVGVITDDRRDKFYFATKVLREGKEAGEERIAESFKLLKTDYIDLLQVHNLLDWRTQLATLERLKEEGKIGMVGMTASKHLIGEAYPIFAGLMKDRRIDTIQIPYNVIEQDCEKELLPLAQELGTGVLVMEPLQKGNYVKELKRQPDLGPLADFGIQTWGQALLAWVISDSRVTSAIPATTRPERIAENALPGSLGTMSQELRDYVREETVRCM